MMWFILRAFLWAAVAVVLALLLPRQLDAVSNAAAGQPLVAGGLVFSPLCLPL